MIARENISSCHEALRLTGFYIDDDPTLPSDQREASNDMAAGLGANAAVFPAPLVAPADVRTCLAACIADCGAVAACTIQGRLRPDGPWFDPASVVTNIHDDTEGGEYAC